MRRTFAATVAVLATLTLAAACGDEETPSDSGSSDPKVIKVTFEGDTVSPNGERVEVSAGQDVVLEVTAEEAGEIHVHSTPEQELEYPAGESEVTIAGIEQPGTVDVESHTLDQVIVQLEVR